MAHCLLKIRIHKVVLNQSPPKNKNQFITATARGYAARKSPRLFRFAHCLPRVRSQTFLPNHSPPEKIELIFYRHCAGIRRCEMASPFSLRALPSVGINSVSKSSSRDAPMRTACGFANERDPPGVRTGMEIGAKDLLSISQSRQLAQSFLAS